MSQAIDEANRGFRFHYRDYLSHKNEPSDAVVYTEASVEDDIGLLRSNFFEKRKLRRTAKRLRQHVT